MENSSTPDRAVDRRGIEQRSESLAVALAIGGDDHPTGIDVQFGDRLWRGVAGSAVIGDGGGLGVFQAIADFVGGGAPAHRRKDEAEHMARPIERRHLVAVAHNGDEMVALTQTHLAQGPGHRFDLAIPRGIGQTLVAVDEGFLARLPPDRYGECTPQIHRYEPLPISAAASSTAATIDA